MGNSESNLLVVCGAKGSKKASNSQNDHDGENARMKDENYENENEEESEGILVKNDQDKYFQKVDFETIANKYPSYKEWMMSPILLKSRIKQKQKRIRWKAGEMIGNGSFGRVIMGLNLQTGSIMAVKQVQIGASNVQAQQERISSLEVEIELLSQLEHKTIVRYLGSHRTKTTFNIFLEYISGGTIASLVEKYGPLNENLIRVYTKQILEGLEYLHVRNIIHRDIKGANVLVDNSGVCKLADFGTAKRISSIVDGESKYMPSLRGTPNWMAPEVIRQSVLGRQSDIWSVGCTVLEMATGKIPWSHLNKENSTMVSILFLIGSAKTHPPLPDGLSPDAIDFLKQCFKINPAERPNVIKLLNHKFITGGDNIERPITIPDDKSRSKTVTPKKRRSILKTLDRIETPMTTKTDKGRRSSQIYKFDFLGELATTMNHNDKPQQEGEEEEKSRSDQNYDSGPKSTLKVHEPEDRSGERKRSYKDMRPQEELKEHKLGLKEIFKKTQLSTTPVEVDNRSFNFDLATRQDLATKQDLHYDLDDLRVEKNASLPESHPVRKFSNDSQSDNDPYKTLTRLRKNSSHQRFPFEGSPTTLQVIENNQIEASEIMENTIMKDYENTLKPPLAALGKRKSNRRPLGGKNDLSITYSRNNLPGKNPEEESSSGASRKSSGQMDVTETNPSHFRRKSLFSENGILRIPSTGKDVPSTPTDDRNGSLKLYGHENLSPETPSKESKDLTSPGSDSEASILNQYNYRPMHSNSKVGIGLGIGNGIELVNPNDSSTSGTPEHSWAKRRFNSLRQLPVRSIKSTIKEVQMDHETPGELDVTREQKNGIASFQNLKLPPSIAPSIVLNQDESQIMVKVKSSPMNAELNKDSFVTKKGGRPFRSMRQIQEQKPVRVVYDIKEDDSKKERDGTENVDSEVENPVIVYKKTITDEKAISSDSGHAEGYEPLRFDQLQMQNKDTEDEEWKGGEDIFINKNGWVKQAWVKEHFQENPTHEIGIEEIEGKYKESMRI